MTEKMTNEELADALDDITRKDRDFLTWHAACRLRAMSWRPIEEAPKDGTYIDVLDDDGNRWTDVRFYNGRFEDNDGNWIAVFRVHYWMPLP